jgi:hypothetical protein
MSQENVELVHKVLVSARPELATTAGRAILMFPSERSNVDRSY